MKIILTIAIITGILGAGFTFKAYQEKKPWPVPDNYKSMKNAVKADAESLATGKELWGQHCKSCHGSKGAGDGPKASTIDTEMRSFLTAAFRAQKPGEIYYKSMIGRKDMPRFEKKIPDEEDRWSIVQYVMSLK